MAREKKKENEKREKKCQKTLEKETFNFQEERRDKPNKYPFPFGNVKGRNL
jgi:hypothetical protein